MRPTQPCGPAEAPRPPLLIFLTDRLRLAQAAHGRGSAPRVPGRAGLEGAVRVCSPAQAPWPRRPLPSEGPASWGPTAQGRPQTPRSWVLFPAASLRGGRRADVPTRRRPRARAVPPGAEWEPTPEVAGAILALLLRRGWPAVAPRNSRSMSFFSVVDTLIFYPPHGHFGKLIHYFVPTIWIYFSLISISPLSFPLPPYSCLQLLSYMLNHYKLVFWTHPEVGFWKCCWLNISLCA